MVVDLRMGVIQAFSLLRMRLFLQTWDLGVCADCFGIIVFGVVSGKLVMCV